LLGLPFALNVVATREGTENFLGLTFNAFNDALDGFFWSAVVLAHMPTPYGVCVGRSRTVRTKVWVTRQLLLPNAGAAVGDQERRRFRHLTCGHRLHVSATTHLATGVPRLDNV
jgi:hypothetical protein